MKNSDPKVVRMQPNVEAAFKKVRVYTKVVRNVKKDWDHINPQRLEGETSPINYLYSGFFWGMSPEKFDYWFDVKQKLIDNM